MSINYVISYTFSPGTTISSSQVNTNFSDNATTWTGLEALTKSFSALRVDATPTAATDVVIKSYADKLNAYRRPVLQYSTSTVVAMETGINGTSGQAQILFPDGTSRTDSTTSRINCTMSQTAAFSGTAQSGIDTGSVSNNTYYSFYAVKVTDSTTTFVMTASLLSPIQANFATLNSRLGTNGWVYLGTLPYGDGSGTANAIPLFTMAGNRVTFYNTGAGAASTNGGQGVRLATVNGTATLTWTYATGTSIASAQVPSHILIGDIQSSLQSGGTLLQIQNSGAIYNFTVIGVGAGSAPVVITPGINLTAGIKQSASGAVNQDIWFHGYVDGALGIGANPLL